MEDLNAVLELKIPRRKRVTAEEIRRRERIKEHLVRNWGLAEAVSKAFAKKHSTMNFEDVINSVDNLFRYFRNLHQGHYGYAISPVVLQEAMNHTLRRFARSRKPLSEKQLCYFLQLARDEVASKVTTAFDPGSEAGREKVLSPLKQALVYEDDKAMRQRLFFIYSIFVRDGMRLTKKRVIQACASERNLFPRRRVVEDALETLRGAYEALGFIGGDLFITPEYLSIN